MAGYEQVIEGICYLLENWNEVEERNEVMHELINYLYVKRSGSQTKHYGG